jgi:hypothetical protein
LQEHFPANVPADSCSDASSLAMSSTARPLSFMDWLHQSVSEVGISRAHEPGGHKDPSSAEVRVCLPPMKYSTRMSLLRGGRSSGSVKVSVTSIRLVQEPH